MSRPESLLYEGPLPRALHLYRQSGNARTLMGVQEGLAQRGPDGESCLRAAVDRILGVFEEPLLATGRGWVIYDLDKKEVIRVLESLRARCLPEALKRLGVTSKEHSAEVRRLRAAAKTAGRRWAASPEASLGAVEGLTLRQVAVELESLAYRSQSPY